MTVIRLDAATLAKLKTENGPVYLGDEAGTPVLRCLLTPAEPPTREPELTEEEWDAIENDPVEYTLEEAWEKIRRGEKF